VYQINTTSVGEVLALGPCKALVAAGTYYSYLLWGTWDDALRICSLDTGKTLSTYNMGLHDEQIQCVAAPPEDTLLCVGGSSGVLSVYNINKDNKKCPTIELVARIPGHTAAITSIGISRSVSLIVTGSEDCTAIVWDLNRRMHVHTMGPHEGPVSALAICDSTGDIVTVCSMSNKDAHMVCKLRLWSVNGALVATVTSDTFINCVAVSSLTNGYSENVVVAGLDDGSIMLWESLDLAPIIKLSDERFPEPVISVHFSDEDVRSSCANLLSSVV
jgi:WD40 repeat protein